MTSAQRQILFVSLICLSLVACSDDSSGNASRTGQAGTFETSTSSPQVCDVTIADDRVEDPPPEVIEDAGSDQRLFGNGNLWVALKASTTKIVQREDGTYGLKFMWWRVDEDSGATLRLSGKRLDGDAPPAIGNVPAGYGAVFQASGVAFPTEGCWEVTGSAGMSTVSFVLEVP